MNRKLINIIIFFTCLIGMGLLNIFSEDKLISEYENRSLEQFPKFSAKTLFSGEYFEKIGLYFSDQFLWRDSFVRISSDLKELKGLPGNNGVTIIVQGGFNDAEEHNVPSVNEVGGEKWVASPEPTNKPEEEISPEPTVEPNITPVLEIDEKPDPTVTPDPEQTPKPTQTPAEPTPTPTAEKDDNGRRIGRILIYNNSAMQLFTANPDAEFHYANTLNSFKERAGEHIKVYSLLAPTNIEFIDNAKYKSLSDSQKDAIGRVNERLKGVISADAYTKLQQHKDEYIYFRTDHHWTALGAYYAYTGFADTAGFDAVSLEKYETETIQNYLGSMYDMTSSSTLRKYPDTITVYKPFVKNEYNIWYEGPVKLKVIDMYHASQKNKYRVFISGDRPLGIIETDVQNGKKILIIKDSYGNAMVPFFLPHYEEIYVVDPRQYEKNIFELIQEKEIQEVLFLNYALIVGDTSFADLITRVMEQ